MVFKEKDTNRGIHHFVRKQVGSDKLQSKPPTVCPPTLLI